MNAILNNKKPRILCWDIETSPMVTYTFELYDQNIRLDQIKEDWTILAWGAKWLGDPESKTMYMDTHNNKDVKDDKKIVQALIKLLEQADICITHNGDKFDIKRVNTRALLNGLPPIKMPQSTDTYKESKKVFDLTSNSLAYASEKINKKYKKLTHPNYPGISLWKAVLAGDHKAWVEMKKYCIHDVFATEEYFIAIRGWIKTQNMACYFDDIKVRCFCGSTNLVKDGPVYIKEGKFQGYICKDCGKRPRGKANLLSKEKRKRLLK